MAYASLSGRAKTNPNAPRAFGVCQRCGIWFNLEDLVWQHEWRGNDLVDIRIRVCTRTCLDVPFEQNRPLYLPPDPPPVDQPRVETFALDEGGPLSWDSADIYYQPQYDYDSGLDWDQSGNSNTDVDYIP